MDTAKTCPFNSASTPRYKINFTPISKQNWLKSKLQSLGEFASRFSFASIYSAWKIGKSNDLSGILYQYWKPGSFVSSIPMPTGTLYLTAEPQLMRAVYQNPRAEHSGLFLDHENKRLFVQSVLKEIYPEEVEKYGIDKVAEMVVFTAESAEIKSLRLPMMEVLGINSIKNYYPELDNIASDLLDSLTDEEKNSCDAELLSFEFAITIISKYMTGYHTDRKNYQLLAKAVAHFSKRLNQLVSHRPLSKIEEQEIKSSLALLRDVITQNIETETPSPFILKLKNAGWEEFKIRATLIFLYFAATETTSSSMNYLLWQLGRPENKQFITDLRNIENEDFITKLIAETLRLHPPAFIQGRQFRQNTLLEIFDDNDRLVKKISLRKKCSILCMTQTAALDASQYKNPHVFNPYRYDSVPTQLPWFPFASGTHVCPGQYLAHAELKALITQVVSKFDIETISPINDIQQRGYFTLRATPARVRLRKRSYGM